MKQNSEVWYATRIVDNNAEIQTYNQPEKIFTHNNYFTVMPASSRGYAEVMKYGETLNDTWTVVANSYYFGRIFNIGDVFYIDGEKTQ
jgi:hypothetical protein